MMKFVVIAVATAIFASLWGLRHFWNAGFFFRKRSVYWRDAYYSVEHRLDLADAGSFKTLSATYGKDDNLVFWKSGAVAEADSSTFEALDNGYALDHKQVYWEGNILEGADRNSFRLITVKHGDDAVVFGVDDRQVFFKGRKVSSNPDQFDYKSFIDQNRP